MSIGLIIRCNATAVEGVLLLAGPLGKYDTELARFVYAEWR